MQPELKKMKVVRCQPMTNPKFIQPFEIVASREDETIFWEMVQSKDSVHIMVEQPSTGHIILVKQVRLPVLVNDDSQNGEVYELCAGLIDKKDKTLFEIAKEEVQEELGYKVNEREIAFIRRFKKSVGLSGGNADLVHVVVTESDLVYPGGGINNEDIIPVFLTYEEAYNLVFTTNSHLDTMTAFGIMYILKYRDYL